MLSFVRIENFALIEMLRVEFGSGLNLITGETGSGKSILVDAVGLLVGDRASQDMVRQGSETARIEGLFTLDRRNPAHKVLKNNGLESGDNTLIIRREISLSGANRVFINDRLTTLAVLALVGRNLVEIHGQHSQQQLLIPSAHLDLLDAFAEAGEFVDAVSTVYHRLEAVHAERDSLERSEQDRLQRVELLRYQLAEIRRLQLQPGLDQSLEEERNLLASSEKRLQGGEEAYQTLYEDDDSVLSRIDRVGRQVEELERLDPALEGLAMRLKEVQFAVEEAAFQLRDYVQDIQFDPHRLEQIEERLAEIERAKRKYGRTLDDVLDYADSIDRELADLEDREASASRLDGELAQLTEAYGKAAAALSERRHEAATALSEAIQSELADLAMEDTRFQVDFAPPATAPTEHGIDIVEFLISANPGEEPRPLARIASGGELSRIMLALENVLRREQHPKTLVFDEVDAGIGGRTAGTLGEKLLHVAGRHQVFCVTHLPQIAAFADHHFHVGKTVKGGRTLVEIHPLDEDARIIELGRMLAGEKVSETTLRQARELLVHRRGG
ncbi:MAG: DNA repair protein RecN [Acidobacteriota bacterium]|jgi:DNA repair protein RecN (Recombination protein N)